ncbi:XF1762 family protein [Idiomarina abyssalis]|uniref:XF1762 family protein n=1 Tax=Idiomarina abyssalis TaxID=86102 RepID=UPI003A932719
MRLISKPITIRNANEFVKVHHRHHRPTSNNSGRWAIEAIDECGVTQGVVIAANPVSATYMDGFTLELTRVCARIDSQKGTCSFLISRCAKIWRLMGGSCLITYTLDSESGASLRGAGWQSVAEVKPHKDWHHKSKRDGIKRCDLPIYNQSKVRWELRL